MKTVRFQTPPKNVKPRDWSHRKAEWVCQACAMHNYVSRMDCRKCGRAWSKTCELIAAGTPPPALPAQAPAAPKPATVPSSLSAAEQALEAAKAADAPEAVIEQWQLEIAKRRSLEEASKTIPSLRARLAVATADANAAMQARERADQQLKAAHEQVDKAKEALSEAKIAEEKAADHLKMVTAEVGPTRRAEETALPTAAAEEAQATEASLKAVLAAFVAAAQPGATPEAKDALEHTLNLAKSQTEARETAKEEAAKKRKEVTAMDLERTEASKRKEEDELPTATQEGDKDLDDEALEVLLRKVPPGKRQRAQERLTQLGVADAAEPKR